MSRYIKVSDETYHKVKAAGGGKKGEMMRIVSEAVKFYINCGGATLLDELPAKLASICKRLDNLESERR